MPAQGVSPLFPKVYYVTKRGVRKLRESLAARGKSWQAVRVDRRGRQGQEGYSAERVIHEILITEFLLTVWQTVQGRPDLELLSIQRRSLVKQSAFWLEVERRWTHLFPDAMFLFRHASGGMVCCFVEVDNGTMNQKQIRAKYRRYVAWSQSPAGKQYLMDLYRCHGAIEPRPTFRLLVVAGGRTGQDDHRRMQELCVPVAKLPTAMQDRLWFTTVEDLCCWQRHPLPLDAAIWRRGRDAGRLETVPPSSGNGQTQAQEHVAGPLNPTSNSLHPLFPRGNRAGT